MAGSLSRCVSGYPLDAADVAHIAADAGPTILSDASKGSDLGKAEVVCTPGCQGKQCGPDGCGGTCGSCVALPASKCSGASVETYPDGSGACLQGQCNYTPTLVGCANGCSGAKCIDCTPNCAGKACGDDGCGGSCGKCGSNQTCAAGACLGTVPECGDCPSGHGDCAPGLRCVTYETAPSPGDASYCSSDCSGAGSSCPPDFQCGQDSVCHAGVVSTCNAGGDSVKIVDRCGNVRDYATSCNDGNPCTVDGCDVATGQCTHWPLNGALSLCPNGYCYQGGCSARYVEPGDGTVIDLSTTLLWRKSAIEANRIGCGKPNYAGDWCAYWCQACKQLYGEGWRMPTHLEMNSLVQSGSCCFDSIFNVEKVDGAGNIIEGTSTPCSYRYWASGGSCSPTTKYAYFGCAGTLCDSTATNAAHCRCVTEWKP